MAVPSCGRRNKVPYRDLFYKDINYTQEEEADHNHLSENPLFDAILLRVRNSAHEWGRASVAGVGSVINTGMPTLTWGL